MHNRGVSCRSRHKINKGQALLLVSVNLVQQGRRRGLETSNLTSRALLPTLSGLVLTTKVTRRVNISYKVTVPKQVRLLTVHGPANMLSRRNILINRLNTIALSRHLQSRQVGQALAIRIGKQLTVLNSHRLQRVHKRVLSFLTDNLLRILKLKSGHRHRGMEMSKQVLDISTGTSHNISLNTLSLIMMNQKRNLKVRLRQTVQHILNPNIRRLNTIFGIRHSTLNASTITLLSRITVTLLRRRVKTIKRNRQHVGKSNQLLTRLTLNNRTNGLTLLIEEIKE